MIWHLIKDAEFRDNPPNPHFVEGRPPHEKILTQYSTDQPEVHDVIAEMRRVIDEFDHRVLIGEIYLPLHRLVAYYGNDLAGAQMPFNFALLSTLWSARSIEKIIADYEARIAGGRLAELGARQPRSSAGREPRRDGAGAGRRDAAADPAGNADALLRRRDRHASGRDRTRSGARSLREERAGHRRRPRRLPHADAMGRDGGAGFSTARPWLPLADDYIHENVANLDADASSILSLYKALIALRRKLPQLVTGAYQPVAAQGDILLYRREGEGGASSLRSISVPSPFRSPRVRSASDAKSCCRPSSTARASRCKARSICAAMKA